jgi:hypothetical protein
MVRIHGQWCGSNWTQGKSQPANAKGVDFTAPCDDALDCACRSHDKDCSNSLGCSAKADRKLVIAALRYANNPINKLFRPVITAKASAVAVGITAASLTRKR